MAPPHSGKTKSQRDKEHRERLLAAGKCIQCTEPLDRKGSRCQKCVDLAKEKRVQQRANSLCTTCGKPKGSVIGSLCDTCKQNAVDRRLRLKEAKLCIDCAEPVLPGYSRCENCNERNLSKYHEWKAAGLCTRCGESKEQQIKSHCNKCLDYIKTYRRELITELTDANLCISCLGENDSSNQFCEKCQAEKAIIYEQRKLLGQCVKCALPAENNFSHCSTCLETFSARYYTRKEMSLCVSCDDGAMATSNYCLICWFKNIAKCRYGNRSKWTELRDQWDRQGGKCAYTGETLIPGQNASSDHKTPISRGGNDDIVNIQWVLKPINTLKGELTHEEFLQFVPTLIALLETVVSRYNITSKILPITDIVLNGAGTPTNISTYMSSLCASK